MKTNIEYHENLMKIMSESMHVWFKEEEKILQKTIKKNSRVLAIACGDGREIQYLLKNTTDVIGIDHDAKAIEAAKENLKGTSIKLILADAQNLPFEDGSFDYVICMTSFTNFGENKIKILNEMKRVLKNIGKLIVSAYADNALEVRLKIYKNLKIPIKRIEKNGRITFDFSGANISEQFSKQELESLFKEVELKIDKIKKAGIGYIAILSKTS